MAGERERGFGIAQIAVVAVVVGMMVGATAILRTATQGREAQATAVSRMQEIALAINAFALSQGRLPCPAPHTDTPANTYKEGTCATAELNGLVPWQTLGLHESMAFDPWGRRISYRVDASLATPGTHMRDLDGSYTSRGLTVCVDSYSCGKTYRYRELSTGGATFALISHGPTGIGARLRPHNGTAYTQQSDGTDTTPNSFAERDNVAAPDVNYRIYALPASAPNVAPTDTAHFDDVVVLGKTVSELAKYIADDGDNRNKPKGADKALSDLTKFRAYSAPNDTSVAGSSIDSGASAEMPIAKLDTGSTTAAASADQRACLWGPDTVALAGKTIRAFFEFSFEDDSGSGTQANADRRGDGLVFAFLPSTAAIEQDDLGCGDGAYLGFDGPLGTEMPTPRFGIEIDVRHNSTHYDPTEARNHIAILRNGIRHSGTTSAGPMCYTVSGATIDADYATKGHHACASERQTMRVTDATSTTLTVPGTRTAQFGTNSFAMVRRSTGNDLSSTGTSYYTLSGSAVSGDDTVLTATGMTVPDVTYEDGVVLGSSFYIVGVSTASRTFTVDGDHRADFPTGSQAFVNNSTGNNGVYTVTATAYDASATATTLTVSETIASATANGRVTAMVRNWMEAGLGTFPATVTAGNASFTIAGDRTSEFPGGATAYAGGAVNKVASSSYSSPNTTVTLSANAAASATSVSGAPRYWLESGRHQPALHAVDLGGYAVTAATRGPSFTVSGDQTTTFVAGAEATVSGSTGNNDTYTVLSSTYTGGNTIVYVAREGTEPDHATANGTITVGTSNHAITGVQTHGTLTVAGDRTTRFPAEADAVLTNRDNAGTYTVVSATLSGGDTVVSVSEPLPTATTGGTLTGLAQFTIVGNYLSLFRPQGLALVVNSLTTPTSLPGLYYIHSATYDGTNTYVSTTDAPDTTTTNSAELITGSWHKMRVEIHSTSTVCTGTDVLVKAWLWDARVPWSLCRGGTTYCDDLNANFVSDGNESAHVWHCVPYTAASQASLWFGFTTGVASGTFRSAPQYRYFGIGAF
ncbi:MAG: hypothetical protein HQL41_11775 [Alphaproteobacteria bacterium]|nr:hypothetical protein [Alphaproteobacteria bacterium]